MVYVEVDAEEVVAGDSHGDQVARVRVCLRHRHRHRHRTSEVAPIEEQIILAKLLEELPEFNAGSPTDHRVHENLHHP